MELTYYFYLAAYFVIDQVTESIRAIKAQLLPFLSTLFSQAREDTFLHQFLTIIPCSNIDLAALINV